MIPLVDIVGEWDKFLFDILSNSTVTNNLNIINRLYLSGGAIIYPAQINVFKAFKECPYKKLSVVILLQDPYHDGSATGIALANDKSMLDKRISPSLRIVEDAIARTVYNNREFNFDATLMKWVKQGVLMLNTALTVEAGKPLSHHDYWVAFTQLVLKKLSDCNSGIIYCLWGKYAESYAQYINPLSNTILRSTHPVYSIYSGKAWECDHFNMINKQLKEFNNTTIIW